MKTCIKCNIEHNITNFSKDKTRPDGYFPYCKVCKNKLRDRKHDIETIKKYRESHPTCRILEAIKRRCNSIKCERYKNYGGRGIKCLITKQEIDFLWFRDEASKMKNPSIDRIDNDGNYEYDNCRFIEMSINSIKNKIKSVKQYSLDNNLIKTWASITEAEKSLKIRNISLVLNGSRYMAGGFIWKYA